MILLGSVLIVLLFIFIFSKNNKNRDTYKKWHQDVLIAHAGGAIEGRVYSNSREAFLSNYEKGHRLFEFDIVLTSDNRPVLRHGWVDSLGQELFKGEPLTHSEFMESEYFGLYEPLDMKELIKLMKKYKDINVIIDAKTNSPAETSLLYEAIVNEMQQLSKEHKKRFVAQAFYEQDVSVIRKFGLENILFVPGREQLSADQIIDFSRRNNIEALSISASNTSMQKLQQLTKSEIKVYTYTVNDLTQASELIKIGVHGFFTDTLPLLNFK